MIKSIEGDGVTATKGFVGMTVADKLAIFYTNEAFLTSSTKVPRLQESIYIFVAHLLCVGLNTMLGVFMRNMTVATSFFIACYSHTDSNIFAREKMVVSAFPQGPLVPHKIDF